ncbi:acyl carrier protein [Streptomyces sp. NPDC019531]|uniref:acyl carrier protein n=1 Tax=Streptomyces sp. NPDC019531 TaxID=3365062 RepID=UPI00384C46D1
MWDKQFAEILRKHLPFLPAIEDLLPGSDLRDLGLDSLGTVDLLASLESVYGVRFVNDELTLENFSTPETIWSALSRLTKASA